MSLGTTVYGMFEFGEDKKIQAIRHVMRPSISYNLSPAFNNYYETYEVIDANGLTTSEVEYTRFENSIFGSPSNRLSSSIGLSLSNNFEAKVRDKDSTATEPKKIILLNNLNFSTSGVILFKLTSLKDSCKSLLLLPLINPLKVIDWFSWEKIKSSKENTFNFLSKTILFLSFLFSFTYHKKSLNIISDLLNPMTLLFSLLMVWYKFKL